MKATPTIAALAASLSLVAGAAPYVFDASQNLDEIGSSYFAPAGHDVWRGLFPDGVVRYFKLADISGPLLTAKSDDGWRASVRGEDVTVIPSRPDRAGKSVQEYRFRTGNLVQICQDDKKSDFNYPPILPCAGTPPKLWQTEEDFKGQVTNSFFGDGRRLRLFYKNPNCLGCLLAMLAVSALSLVFATSRLAKALGLVFAAVCLLLMIKTESRSALVAFCAATGVLLSLRLPRLHIRSWRKIGLISLGGLLVACVLAFGYSARFRQTEANRKSDSIRLEALPSFPAMVAAGPHGWPEPVMGMTYTMWFQDLGRNILIKDMINEHLTFLVMHCTTFRLLYLFGWFSLLFLLFLYTRQGGSPAGLCAWLVLGVCAGLNRVYEAPTLFILPTLFLLIALVRYRWRTSIMPLVCCFSAAALGSLTVLVSIHVIGIVADAAPSVCSDGVLVFINGKSPRHWLVDEPSVCPPHLVGKDIRSFYCQNPQSDPLGFARSIDDVPADALHITLMGASCQRFVDCVKSLNCHRLPEHVTFISPTISPKEIPESLRKTCHLDIIIGTLLARYFTDDGTMPDWVTLVPGAEIYIPGWMRFCVN